MARSRAIRVAKASTSARHSRARPRQPRCVPTESVIAGVEHPFSRTRGDDRPISELARGQYGVVGRSQLMERGWTDGEIKWRIRTGRLHRLHAGVYGVGHDLIPKQ